MLMTEFQFRNSFLTWTVDQTNKAISIVLKSILLGGRFFLLAAKWTIALFIQGSC